MLLALAAQATPLHADPAGSVAIGGFQLESTTRIGRTVYEYSYRATATHQAASPPYAGLAASLSSSTPNTTVVDGSLDCGTLWGVGTARGAAPCADTFRIRQDRRFAIDWSALAWSVSGDALADGDGDGVPDTDDRCPADADPAQADADGDGLGDACDECPADAGNTCNLAVTVSGTVRGAGAPLAGAVVRLGGGGIIATTAGDGSFSAVTAGAAEIAFDGLNRFVAIEASAPGYGTGHGKVVLEAGITTYTADLSLLAASDRIDPADNANGGVDTVVTHDGREVGALEIPAQALPEGVTQVTGSVTYIDPTGTDLGALPGGDFLALPAGADPNQDQPVTLESLGMMELDLADQNGTPVTSLDAPATLCMTVPDGLLGSVTDGEQIPLWHYDASLGLWVEEGHGTVDLDASPPQMCGEITHFSWWNYDRPIETHACFKFHFVDADSGLYVDDLDWSLEGVNWSGGASERKCACDADDPGPGMDPGNPPYAGTCPAGPVDSFTVMVSPAAGPPLTSRVVTYRDGTRYYLRANGDGTYSLTTDPGQALVVENPSLQGSCFAGTDVQNGRFLDYQDGVAPNGILPLRRPNRAPLIGAFSLTPDLLLAGETANAAVNVTDPEGDPFDVDWSVYCAYADAAMTPATDTSAGGPDFTSTFTAPTVLDRSPTLCEVQVQATDSRGGTSSASRMVSVYAPELVGACTIEGHLYGPDGMPLPPVPVTLRQLEASTCDGEATTDGYDRTIVSEPGGSYRFEGVPCCSPCGLSGFAGRLSFPVLRNGQEWTVTQQLFQFCATEAASIIGSPTCRSDVFSPTVWGTLTGTRYPVPGEAGDPGSRLFTVRVGAELPFPGPLPSIYAPILDTQVTGQPGSPLAWSIPVPVGEGSIEDFGGPVTRWSVPRRDVAAVQDLNGSGYVFGTAYGSDGQPAGPGVSVWLELPAGLTYQAETDDAGGFAFGPVPTGEVEVYTNRWQVGPYGNGWSVREFVRGHGTAVRVDLYGAQSCPLQGVVYGGDGLPRGQLGVLIGQLAPNGNLASLSASLSDPVGIFQFPEVWPGNLALHTSDCWHDGGAGAYTCDQAERRVGFGTCPLPGLGEPLSYDLPLQRFRSECPGLGNAPVPPLQ